ncbi:hypothetical protein Clacol_003035 [Clathrus columnatus]|uniref:Uncharacterized protein n=1 Tax=Clathrus columnatus TaxID=1419009 RepID=A0AAV5A729_9AGAM|nr:hypothetical protein Clacol_003035 [Clathrus columnatus]
MTALTMTPFDVVKTRLQTQSTGNSSFRPSSQICCTPSNAHCVRNMSSFARAAHTEEIICLWDHGQLRTERVTGFSDAFKKVFRTEGIRGLWKGVGTSLIMSVPASSTYMVTYDYLVHTVMPPLSPFPSMTPLISGVIARTLVSSAASPLELLRTNLQSTPISPDKPNTLSSVLSNIRVLVRSQGFGSLWRGLGPTLYRDVTFSGLYWALYENFKISFEEQGYHGVPFAFASGSISGTIATVFTNPFDVVKTRRQALLMSTAERSSVSVISVLTQILRTEGAAALFTGLTPRIGKIAPACGIMIGCYEGVGRLLTKKSTTDD